MKESLQMCYFAVVILISLLLVVEAPAVELFRYTLTMPGGQEFEYVFETDEQGVVPETIDRDEAEEIAIQWIMSFHGGPQIGSIESVSFRLNPIPHWLVASPIPLKVPSSTCCSRWFCPTASS